MSTGETALGAALLALLLASPPAGAQAPDLNALAIDWLRGDWAIPLLCQIGGEPLRGLRRVRIEPDERRTPEWVGRFVVLELKAESASRCFDDMGREESDVRGRLVFRLDGHSRPDSAMRDFKQALRRERGFEFRIESGKLLLRDVGPEPGPPRRVDFRGGKLSARAVQRGTDAARLLADFPQPRKVTFELTARDGTVLRWHAAGL